MAPEEPVAEAAPPPPVLTEVHLPILEIERPFRFSDELRGLSTMAMELGLSDLPGVVARVPGDAAPPAVLLSLPAARRQVDARFTASGTEAAVEFELELCVAGGACTTTTATAPRDAPWEAYGTLLEGAAEGLGLPVSPELAANWRIPGSKDPYAELITGRGAATLYGILPPPATPDDKRSNPVLRAVFIDPRQPIALWCLARWQVGTTADGGDAADTLARASLVRPWSAMLDADRATVLAAQGKTDQAVMVWEHLLEGQPRDPRFLEPTARALLAAKRPEEAGRVLEGVPPEFEWEPRVASLRVAIYESVQGTVGIDPLLAHWQETDPDALEPVQRRLELRVREARFAEALELVPALRSRAPGPQSDALEVALLVALGRLREAAERAPADVAARLIARADREQDPAATLVGLDAENPETRLAVADGRLWQGKASEALPDLERMARELPWRAEVQAARARALEGLGRATEAAEAWKLAWELDPGAEGGPVTPTRVASTFQYVTNAPPEAEEAPVGRMGPEL